MIRVTTRRGTIEIMARADRAVSTGHGLHPLRLCRGGGEHADQPPARPLRQDPGVQVLRLPHRKGRGTGRGGVEAVAQRCRSALSAQRPARAIDKGLVRPFRGWAKPLGRSRGPLGLLRATSPPSPPFNPKHPPSPNAGTCDQHGPRPPLPGGGRSGNLSQKPGRHQGLHHKPHPPLRRVRPPRGGRGPLRSALGVGGGLGHPSPQPPHPRTHPIRSTRVAQALARATSTGLARPSPGVGEVATLARSLTVIRGWTINHTRPGAASPTQGRARPFALSLGVGRGTLAIFLQPPHRHTHPIRNNRIAQTLARATSTGLARPSPGVGEVATSARSPTVIQGLTP